MTRALDETRAVLEQIPKGRVLVAVSGGKDSLCTLDVCVRHFGPENVAGFLMHLVPDLECEWEHARKLERRFGVKIHGVPHWTLSHLMRECAFRPYVAGAERIKALKQPDIERYVRDKLGGTWIAWGNRAADSVVRNAYLKRIRGVDQKFQRFYPIFTWKKPDVYGYLHGRKLPVPAITGGRVQMGGVSLTAECLSWIRDNYPSDLTKILEVFPFAGALLHRQELEHRGQTREEDQHKRLQKRPVRSAKAQDVRHAAPPPVAAQRGAVQPARDR